jgi:hypothetical protein
MAKDLWDYVKAFDLHHKWESAVAIAGFLIGLGLKLGVGFSVAAMLAFDLAVLAALIFWFGFVAWRKERGELAAEKERHQNKWRGLDREQKSTLTRLLEGQPSHPDLLIFNNLTPDCQTLGADLHDAITDAKISVPVRPTKGPAWLTSGITVYVRKGEPRGAVLQNALKTVLGIDVHLDESSRDSSPQIRIGCRG